MGSAFFHKASTAMPDDDDILTERRTRAGARVYARTQKVRLRINGTTHELMLDPRVTLLDALHEVGRLAGAKNGCGRGQCGACTVLVDRQRINACLTLAIMQEGRDITTVAGLRQDGAPHPVQTAFMEHGGFWCGYCTPGGQAYSTVALLSEAAGGQASAITPGERLEGLRDDEIRERMSGNLCRCGAYPNIVAAIRNVVERTAAPGS